MDKNINATTELKKYIKALKYGGVLEKYNVRLETSANGSLSVYSLTDNSHMPFAKWLKSVGKTSDVFGEEVKEELQEQLYEENKDYVFGLSSDEYYALFDYRTKEQGLEGEDDSDDERYEAMFVKDMSYSGVSLEKLVADLIKERKRGLRNYSEKTKAKAVEVVKDYLSLFDNLDDDMVDAFLYNVLEIEMTCSQKMTLDFSDPNELATALVDEFPQLCGKEAQKRIAEEMNGESFIENFVDNVSLLLKRRFPEFYEIVRKYESNDYETPHCQCKFRRPHRFTDEFGRKFSTKTMCLWGDEFLIAKDQCPGELLCFSAKDYKWLIDEIPYMEIGKIKYYIAG